MARKRPAGKTSSDPNLFRPEPPVANKSVKDTFCGREQELRYCLVTLKDNLDVDGARSETDDKRPWIIHGESRCGKSHLARRILIDLPENRDRLHIVVPAREQLSALKVMRAVFRELIGPFRERINDQRRPEPIDRPDAVRVLDDIVDRTEQLLREGQTATESTERGDEVSVEGGIEFGGFLGRLTSKLLSKSTSKTGRQLVIRAPDAFRVAEICRAMIEALIIRKLVRHILFLIDDVDLLEGYRTPTRNGQAERSVLANALCELHSEPGVDVLLTARSWYAYTTKEFEDLIDLTDKRLGPEDLIQIHDRRLKHYGDDGFLTPDAIRQAAGEMDGLPGVFLNYLRFTHKSYRFGGTAGYRDFPWFLGVFRQQFETLKATCSPAAEALLGAIQSGKMVITVADSNPFHGTAFDNQFVFQSYHNEKAYFAAPIIRKILHEGGSLPASGGTNT